MWPWQIPGKANSWGSQKDYANRDAMNTGIATATGDLANPGLQLRQHCREVWGLRNESEGGCSIKTTALKAQETNETGLQPLRLGPQVERCRWGKKKKKKKRGTSTRLQELGDERSDRSRWRRHGERLPNTLIDQPACCGRSINIKHGGW